MRQQPKTAGFVLAAVLFAAGGLFGQDTASSGINNADNAWVLLGAALVLFMTPGLAFFYGGLVRKKNVLSILIQCFILICLVSVQWVFFGYSLAFGPDIKGLIGSLKWAGLAGVGLTPNPDYAATIPHQTFMIFQAMFAIITPGLILGAFAERMKFGAFVIFSLAWSIFVYDPVCHWLWGAGGFLRRLGAVDFAGGLVVHINAGMAALAAALVLGRRHGYPSSISPPHSLPFAVLGAGILWFGWFGFNAGSALNAGPLATSAFVATNSAGAVAGLVWALLDWIFNSRPTVLGLITGAVAGLAAVTPAAGFVTPAGAMAIGAFASILCYLFVTFLKPKLGYDDSLDAFGVHGIGGLWGSIALGLFATKTVNPAGVDGLFAGNPAQLWSQLIAVGVVAAYAFLASFLILKLVDWTVGLRIGQQEEKIGLDLIEHRETGYTILD